MVIPIRAHWTLLKGCLNATSTLVVGPGREQSPRAIAATITKLPRLDVSLRLLVFVMLFYETRLCMRHCGRFRVRVLFATAGRTRSALEMFLLRNSEGHIQQRTIVQMDEIHLRIPESSIM